MRYILRNKRKIEKAIGKRLLYRITSAVHDLNNYETTPEEHSNEGDEFPTILLNDPEHTVNSIAFYKVKQQYDVVTLAFKEFI